ncbi:MAG: pirin family protein [Methanosarcinales archaeon]|nr:pirin family protein [Methanosarcinales archaeon]
MIEIRSPESIFQTEGPIQKGTFLGRWHFSFGDYHDPRFMGLGVLRVFNDDTLSPGAVWPLHPHREIEVVTCCVAGEFKHADQRGEGGVLLPGWVQHTTVGKGMWHSEINNLQDAPMRFIQMWFRPDRPGLEPSVEQKQASREDRCDRLLPLVSDRHKDALPIHSPARVFSCFLRKGKSVDHQLPEGQGVYLYLLEGGPVQVNDEAVAHLGTAIVREGDRIIVRAEQDSELLLVEVKL